VFSLRTVAVVACVVISSLASVDTACAADSDEGDVPANIRADPGLTHLLRVMMRQSGTFRDQVRRLRARPHVSVSIVLDEEGPPPERSKSRAECVISRYEYGRIVARVRVWSWQNLPELIAHELEHVIEYVEGTPFRLMAAHPNSRVWELSKGHFETGRAIAAGQHVARETSGRAMARR
jgi:hypothetical protein